MSPSLDTDRDPAPPYRVDREPPFTAAQEARVHQILSQTPQRRLRISALLLMSFGFGMFVQQVADRMALPPVPSSTPAYERDATMLLRDPSPIIDLDACVAVDDGRCYAGYQPCCTCVGCPSCIGRAVSGARQRRLLAPGELLPSR